MTSADDPARPDPARPAAGAGGPPPGPGAVGPPAVPGADGAAQPPLDRMADAGAPDPAVVAGWSADDAIADRRRRWWARRQLDEEVGLAGALLDRAEAGRPVALEVAGGRRLTGHLWWVAPAAVGVRTAAGDALVDLAAVVAIRDAPGRDTPPAVPSARTVEALGDGTLAEALAGLAAEEPAVAVHGRDDRRIATGRLVAAGRDLLVVEEADGQRALVAATAVAWALVER